MTDHEAKAREILDGEMDPRHGEPFAMFREREARIRSAIVTALREAESRGQNDIWLWLDDDSADDPIMNGIVKSWMAKHKRAAAIRSRNDE